MGKKEVKELLEGVDKGNVRVGKLGGWVGEVGKKWKVKEGGEVYLFGRRVEGEGDVVIKCVKG